MDAPGLVILPTHRVVFGLEGFSLYSKAMQVMKYFEVEDLGAITDVQDAVRRLREAGKDRTALLAVTAQERFLAEGTPRRAIAEPERHVGATALARCSAAA